MKILPGDPFANDQVIPEEVLKNLYAHFGLDQPLMKQYLLYLKGCFQGNFGPSLIYSGKPVSQIIQEGFFKTVQIGIQAFFLSLLFGFALGYFSATHLNQWQDHIGLTFSTLGLSIPNFVVASFLQYYLSVKLSWFPVARWEDFSSSFLPSLALSFMPTAYIAKLMRSTISDILQSEYIQLAKMKGLSSFAIFFRHVLPSACLPLLGFLGPIMAYFFTGSFVIEKIFAIPGLGQWMVLSILHRDYTTVLGLIVFYSMMLLLCIFFMDLCRALLDPKLRGEKLL